METNAPVFAVIGHPNEGKSAVLSTLAEDDSVRVSPIPGETTRCQAFPVRIDGKELLRFVDTPGFQNPRRILTWLRQHDEGTDILANFIAAHRTQEAFADDCELLRPVRDGAGVIFVADGSRPVRNTDLAEMEILRLSGAPRMAVINSKQGEPGYMEDWRREFKRHFNVVRIFNANRATFAERIALLESLRAIDQDLEPALDQVIEGLRLDWRERSSQAAHLIVTMLAKTLSYSRSARLIKKDTEADVRQALLTQYSTFLRQSEQQTHARIRRLYRHNLFRVELPPHSILEEDLFSERTWQFLGLSQGQLTLAGAIGGATLGAGIDLSLAGLSFGVFSSLGGVAGALGAAFKGKQLSTVRLPGLPATGQHLQVGPAENIQLLYILIDRALLLYAHVINWAHGRRDYSQLPWPADNSRRGDTSSWGREEQGIATAFFKSLGSHDVIPAEKAAKALTDLVERRMQGISETNLT
ncbi:MAG: hypothetical protein CSA21_04180 [Deltaproteobacteria bacterium]|nr:MAG: hypothetical protein CSA21_04180 [Deltaproteobacteria bacterium]